MELLRKIFEEDYVKFAWCTIEALIACSHIAVLLGFRNSKIDYLRTQAHYFLLDGLTHLFHILYYSLDQVNLVAWVNWRIQIFVHFYFFLNLFLNPPSTSTDRLKKVFHWSCIEFKEKRFDFINCFWEILGTVADIMAHLFGFYYMALTLDKFYFLIILASVFLINSILLIIRKEFTTEKHMMPQFFQDILKKFIK